MKKDESQPELVIPEYKIVSQESLRFYLEGYKAILGKFQFTDSSPIARVVEDICHIFNCLLEAHVIYNMGPNVDPIGTKKTDLTEVCMVYTTCR